MKVVGILLMSLLVLFTVPVRAEEITVAAASDLSFAFRELIPRFERQTGHTVRLSLGSSGNFFAQIQNGAPFDLYFSADVEYPRRLEAAGLAEPGTLYRYAVGRVVLWVPQDSKMDVAGMGMRALLLPAVRRIAIANPEHAPYGRAAAAAMRHYALYESVEQKLVFGENISQAAQFVESGSADAGILALSLALAPPMARAGRYWEIPEDAHPPIEQGAIILRSSARKETAQAFLDYVKSPAGAAVMRRYGFQLPEERAR